MHAVVCDFQSNPAPPQEKSCSDSDRNVSSLTIGTLSFAAGDATQQEIASDQSAANEADDTESLPDSIEGTNEKVDFAFMFFM